MTAKIKLLCLSACMLTACSGMQGGSPQDQYIAAMSQCEKLEALVAGHKKGFPVLRTTQTTVKYMDIWKARYHLIGDACQVWGWGNNKFSYVCTLTEPAKEVAMSHYEQAKSKAAECLGSGWTMKEGPRKQGEGVQATFSKAGETTVVTTMAVSSPQMFASEWRSYYFVGDPGDVLPNQ